jgi:hypothetical protein
MPTGWRHCVLRPRATCASSEIAGLGPNLSGTTFAGGWAGAYWSDWRLGGAVVGRGKVIRELVRDHQRNRVEVRWVTISPSLDRMGCEDQVMMMNEAVGIRGGATRSVVEEAPIGPGLLVVILGSCLGEGYPPTPTPPTLGVGHPCVSTSPRAT